MFHYGMLKLVTSGRPFHSQDLPRQMGIPFFGPTTQADLKFGPTETRMHYPPEPPLRGSNLRFTPEEHSHPPLVLMNYLVFYD